MEANYVKLAQKEEKDQVLDLQELTDKNILKLATLKISARLNMQQRREGQYGVLNTTKDNVTT